MLKDISEERYNLDEVVSTGWRLFWANFYKIATIVLVVAVPAQLWALFMRDWFLVEQIGVVGASLLGMLIGLFFASLSLILTMAVMMVIDASVNGQALSWQRAMRLAMSRWGSALIANVCSSLIIFMMMFLLIIPGIIWSVYYLFVLHAVVLRGMPGWDALDYSKALVTGQWWRVFCYSLIIAVIMIPFILVIMVLPNVLPFDQRIVQFFANILVNMISMLAISMTTVLFLNTDLMLRKRFDAPQ